MQNTEGVDMSTERYSASVKLSLHEFNESGWKEAVNAAKHPGYFSMAHAFRDAAIKADNEGNAARGKALWLLEEACSMMLAPDSMNEPFKPYAQFSDRRSKIPDDFTDEDVEFFSVIVASIDNIWLKARISDLVWLLQRPRKIQYALDAIDAYRSIPLEPDTWAFDSGDCWRRAFILARQVKAAAQDRRTEMWSLVLKRLNATTLQDRFLAVRLADLLDGEIPQEHYHDVAEKLESLAIETSGEKKWLESGEQFQVACQWYGYAQITDKAVETRIKSAECLVKEAEMRLSGDSPSHSVAREYYEQAIQLLRKIPKKLRAKDHVDERILALLELMKNSGEKALGEMKLFQSPEIDISELIENARAAIKGKSIVDALRELANVRPYTQADKLRTSAIEMLRNSAFRSFFPTTHFGNDGRVVAKQSGVVFAGGNTAEENEAIWAEMISEYKIMIGLAVRGSILPALEQIRMEHRLREADLRIIAQRSPAVPIGREYQWSKALFAGYDGDYCAALHLLVPQIENMVRVQLKTAGAITANLDERGIETEIGLSSLMDTPEAEKVFGPDVGFEIKALFCDPFGPNLRNELSHGLLNDGIFTTDLPVYAWWLAFKMVFNNFWIAATQNMPRSGAKNEPK